MKIATFGYPDTVVFRDGMDFHMNMRGQRGVIQRVVRPPESRLPTSRGLNVTGIETSFPLARCMSGAPIIARERDTFTLYGVGIGNLDSRTRVEREENEDGVIIHTEVVQHGLAVAMTDILDWRPQLLEGASLGDLFQIV